MGCSRLTHSGYGGFLPTPTLVNSETAALSCPMIDRAVYSSTVSRRATAYECKPKQASAGIVDEEKTIENIQQYYQA